MDNQASYHYSSICCVNLKRILYISRDYVISDPTPILRRESTVSVEFARPIPIGVYDRNENGHPGVPLCLWEREPTLWRGVDIHLPPV